MTHATTTPTTAARPSPDALAAMFLNDRNYDAATIKTSRTDLAVLDPGDAASVRRILGDAPAPEPAEAEAELPDWTPEPESIVWWAEELAHLEGQREDCLLMPMTLASHDLMIAEARAKVVDLGGDVLMGPCPVSSEMMSRFDAEDEGWSASLRAEPPDGREADPGAWPSWTDDDRWAPTDPGEPSDGSSRADLAPVKVRPSRKPSPIPTLAPISGGSPTIADALDAAWLADQDARRQPTRSRTAEERHAADVDMTTVGAV